MVADSGFYYVTLVNYNRDMDMFTQLAAIAITLVIALIRSFPNRPSALSQDELRRRVESGDPDAAYELARRPLLRAIDGLMVVKVTVAVAVLAVLLVITGGWAGFLLLIIYLLSAEFVAARGWLAGLAGSMSRTIEPMTIAAVRILAPLLNMFAPRRLGTPEASIASREDLAEMIARDRTVFTSAQKAKLQGALAFGDLKVSDAMVPRDQIVSVETTETVGPVLLDRLHHAGHNIFVAVKRGIDNIQGLLYMADIVHPDPELKKVKDAVRPTVHYIAANAPLSAVLVASLQSGRQLFIVVDENGNTQGLITLRDALVKLMGTAPPDHTYTSTDPEKVLKV
jgi:CBS domain containing-hemolysin-like protein